MARLARVVIPGIPQHIVQRGNRRQKVFFNPEDKQAYLEILEEQCRDFGVKIWAYCLMDNHVHLIAVPQEDESLARGIGETNRLYTRRIHFRKGWRGYLWQGRFLSCPMDETYLYASVRYVEQNPVRAGMVKKAEDYPWSSARAHVYWDRTESEGLLSDFYLLDEINDWREYLVEGEDKREKLGAGLRTGRPMGNPDFLKRLELISGRILTKRKPGPKPQKPV